MTDLEIIEYIEGDGEIKCSGYNGESISNGRNRAPRASVRVFFYSRKTFAQLPHIR